MGSGWRGSRLQVELINDLLHPQSIRLPLNARPTSNRWDPDFDLTSAGIVGPFQGRIVQVQYQPLSLERHNQ